MSLQNSSKINGTFTSYWTEGIVSSKATLHLPEGRLDADMVEVGDEFESLKKEEFEGDNGEIYEVCPVCHDHVIKKVMVSNKHSDSAFEEIKVCSDASCEYND